MKKIECIIRPEKVTSVKEALEQIGVVGMTVTQVNGRGRQGGITLEWRAGEYNIDFLPKIKLDIVIDEEICEEIVDIICDTARTGREGDGMIFILPVEETIRVRTNGACKFNAVEYNEEVAQ